MATVKLAVVKWEGRLQCIYLNEYRIAGGKPWGGGKVVAEWDVKPADILTALGRPADKPPLEDAGED